MTQPAPQHVAPPAAEMQTAPYPAPLSDPLAESIPTSASESPFKRRLRKFRRLKRGYWSFLLVATAYVIT